MDARSDFLDEMAAMANLQSLSDNGTQPISAEDQAMLKQMEDDEERFFQSMSIPFTPRINTSAN